MIKPLAAARGDFNLCFQLYPGLWILQHDLLLSRFQCLLITFKYEMILIKVRYTCKGIWKLFSAIPWTVLMDPRISSVILQ